MAQITQSEALAKGLTLVEDYGNGRGAMNANGGKTQGAFFASALRTATAVSADMVNSDALGIVLFLDVTAASGTGGLIVAVEVKDPVTGKYFQYNLSHAAILTTGLKIVVISQGASTTGANVLAACNLPLPHTFRVKVLHGDATNYTYSLGYCLIP